MGRSEGQEFVGGEGGEEVNLFEIEVGGGGLNNYILIKMIRKTWRERNPW